MKEFKKYVRYLLPKSIVRHQILSGPLKGSWIVTSWHDYPAAILGYTERSLVNWFKKHVIKGETWLDIGAHYGYTAIALSRLVGEEGKVFAFEPMLATAGHLSRTRSINQYSQLIIFPFGLGNGQTIELRKLPVERGMVDSSLINKNLDNVKPTWFETVTIVNLDNIWTSICENSRAIHGVKIDVQGMEIEVLNGMKSLLTAYKPKLVIELHRGVNRQEFLNIIKSMGYSGNAISIESSKEVNETQLFDNNSYVFPI